MKPVTLTVAAAVAAALASSVSATTITNLVGDKDVLGYAPSEYPDARPPAVSTDPDDPAGFDVYLGGAATQVRNWTHTFVLPEGEEIVSATLQIMTGEMEDGGGWQGGVTHDGSDYDSLLILDGTEFAGAFDDVTTYDSLYPQLSTFDLTDYFGDLLDGALDVTLDPQGDFIALDWAELTIETAPVAAAVPLPGAGLMLLSGIGGLAAWRRRKA